MSTWRARNFPRYTLRSHLSLTPPDHPTGMPPVVCLTHNSRTLYDDPSSGLYLDRRGQPDGASRPRGPGPNGERYRGLIVRDGPLAVTIRAEPDVTRQEQLARLAYPNPAFTYSREGAGFT